VEGREIEHPNMLWSPVQSSAVDLGKSPVKIW